VTIIDEGGHFDFSMYCKLAMQDMMGQLIEFSHWSWILCLVFYALSGLLAGALDWHGMELEIIMLCGVILGFVSVAGFGAWTLWHFQTMQNNFNDHLRETDAMAAQEGSATGPDGGHPLARTASANVPMRSGKLAQEKVMSWAVDRMYLDVVQALNFLSCYSFARIFCSKRYWASPSDFEGQEWMVIVYALVYVVNGFILMPVILPWAAVLLVVPPYMDAQDMLRLEEAVGERGHRPKGISAAKAAKLLSRRPDHVLKEANLLDFVTRYNPREITDREHQEQIHKARTANPWITTVFCGCSKTPESLANSDGGLAPLGSLARASTATGSANLGTDAEMGVQGEDVEMKAKIMRVSHLEPGLASPRSSVRSSLSAPVAFVPPTFKRVDSDFAAIRRNQSTL